MADYPSTNDLKILSDNFLAYIQTFEKYGKLNPLFINPTEMLKVGEESRKNYIELIEELGTVGLQIDGLVPMTREITINGVTHDLSEDREWIIETGGDRNVDGGGWDDVYLPLQNIDGGSF